ncbi:hypothetical protein BDZ91DRAFT_745056 [Kalaharituber pfeilii]|nr:hypothetical protein BDZ91DRAFT_745056 [Kalaharituber pfeilii]
MGLYKCTTISEEKGQGMVATAAIPAGTLIIAEEPLFTLPDPRILAYISIRNHAPFPNSKLNELVTEAVQKLPKEKQIAFLGLHNAYPKDDTAPFLGIWQTNCFAVGNDDTQSGIFVESSRINHSCVPNAIHTWNYNTKLMEVRATKDIPEGTEITFCYLSLKEVMQPHKSRRQTLQDRYKFTCKCAGCTPPENNTRDTRRALLTKLDAEVGNGMLIFTNPARALKNCRRLLDLLPLEHTEAEICRVYHDAFQIAIAHGDQARASAFLELGLKSRNFYAGGGGKEWGPELEELIRRPQGHHTFHAVSNRWSSRVSDKKKEGSAGFEAWLWAKAEK